MSALGLVIQERYEHFYKHDRTVTKDREINKYCQLAKAASFLVSYNNMSLITVLDIEENCPDNWDIERFVKMCRKSYEKRLIIAASLIIAELDRIM